MKNVIVSEQDGIMDDDGRQLGRTNDKNMIAVCFGISSKSQIPGNVKYLVASGGTDYAQILDCPPQFIDWIERHIGATIEEFFLDLGEYYYDIENDIYYGKYRKDGIENPIKQEHRMIYRLVNRKTFNKLKSL